MPVGPYRGTRRSMRTGLRPDQGPAAAPRRQRHELDAKEPAEIKQAKAATRSQVGPAGRYRRQTEEATNSGVGWDKRHRPRDPPIGGQPNFPVAEDEPAAPSPG